MEEDFFSLIWGDLYKLCDEKVPLGLSVDLNELHKDILYNWILLPLWLTIYTFYITGWETDVFPTVELSEEEKKLPEEERLTTFFVENFYQLPLGINKADSIDLREVIESIDFEKNDQRLRVIYLYPSTVNLNKIAEHLKDDELYYLIIPWPRISDAKKIENCYFLVSSILADSDFYKSSEEDTIVPEERVELSKEDIMKYFTMKFNFKVYYEKEMLRIRELVIDKIKSILDDKGVKYEVKELQEIINKTLGREPGKFKDIWINARDDILGDLEIWIYDNILPPNFQEQLEGNEKREIYSKYFKYFEQINRRFSSEKPVDYESIILDTGSIIEKFVKEYFEHGEREIFSNSIHDLYEKHKISRLVRSDLLNLKEYYNVAKHSYKQEITEEDALHVLRLAEQIFRRLKP